MRGAPAFHACTHAAAELRRRPHTLLARHRLCLPCIPPPTGSAGWRMRPRMMLRPWAWTASPPARAPVQAASSPGVALASMVARSLLLQGRPALRMQPALRTRLRSSARWSCEGWRAVSTPPCALHCAPPGGGHLSIYGSCIKAPTTQGRGVGVEQGGVHRTTMHHYLTAATSHAAALLAHAPAGPVALTQS